MVAINHAGSHLHFSVFLEASEINKQNESLCFYLFFSISGLMYLKKLKKQNM